MKLCKDCKWCVIDKLDGRTRLCTHPNAPSRMCVVDGLTLRDECEVQRAEEWFWSRVIPQTCGKEGRWFEERPK